MWQYWAKPILYYYRKSIITVAILVTAVAWLGTSWGVFRLPFAKVNAFEAISDNTALILETNQYEAMFEELKASSYYQDLFSLSLLQKWGKDLTFMDSLFKETASYKKILDEAHIVSGLQPTSNKSADWLFVLDKYKEKFDIDLFLEELKPYKVTQTTYRGRLIYTLKFEDGKTIALAVFKGVILTSPVTFLVESGIEQLDNIASTIYRKDSFKKVNEQVVKDGGNLVVYVNFKSITTLTSIMTESNPRAIMGLTALGAWMGLDARFLDSGFILSGHLYPDKEHRFLQALCRQEAPKDSKIAAYIPKNLGAMLYLGWDKFDEFYKSYQTEDYKDFETYFLPWIGREAAIIFKDPTDDNNAFEKDKLVFVQSKDTSHTWRLLQRYAHQFGELDKKVYQNFEITQIVAQDILKPLFGDEINPIQNPYYTMVGDYIVFANSLPTLENWIKNYNSNQTILELPEYDAFLTQAKNQSNIYALLSTPNSIKFLQHFLRSEWDEYITGPFQQFQNIYPVGIQFFGFKEHFLVTLSASHNKVEAKKSNRAATAWEVELEADAAVAPEVVATGDGNYHIFAQDVNHRVYLFDKNGENLWSKDKILDGKINSEVFEIDYRMDGDYHYAFSTARTIYVWDKAGNESTKISLTSKAANGLLALDYGKGPRLFIACKNGHLYGYEETGKPLSGWQPLAKAGRVDYPMAYMEYENNRYFITVNKAGKCQAFKRQGTPYFKGGKLGNALSGWGIDSKIGRIAAGNKNGKIRVLNRFGKGFGFSPVKGMTKEVQFVYADVIGDARKDYIRVSPDKMAVHYYTKEKNAKGKEKDVLKEAGVYPLGEAAALKAFAVDVVGYDKQFIGLLESENGSIRLLDEKGVLQNGFPMAGTSTFEIVDLFGENGNTLVVANRNKIHAYKLKL